ncbi:MAG: NADH-quinone oxidoreductase subunit C [Steroidobacteraceae bacterium]
MSRTETLAATIESRLGPRVRRVAGVAGEITFEVAPADLPDVARALRDEREFAFEQLIDVCGVDYLHYGRAEWRTTEASSSGFGRATGRGGEAVVPESCPSRFAVVYHLLSVSRNVRLRLRVWCAEAEPPMVDSVVDVWPSANWFEREAFDLFGILFRGHPDLRRILTDYGFVGHPFRKDFPLSGNVEVRYDPAEGRVVYQPVTIEPRVIVPKVIRQDNRYEPALEEPRRDG